jgi:hypothetical protein
MTRLFGRGELKAAILDVLEGIEPANGYAIMQALAGAIGGGWRPSPGAVYPALLGLEDEGLIVGADDGTGSVVYELTDAGRAARAGAEGVLSAVADRARTAPPAPTVGSLLDAFTSGAPTRAHRLSPAGVIAVQRLLESTELKLTKIVDKENNDG